MKYLPLKIWLAVTIMPTIVAAIIRLAWEASINPSAASLTMIIVVIAALLGTLILLVYLIIKPSLKKLKSLPVTIWVMAIATAGLIGGIIHFINFVPSPEADAPLSIVIAALHLLTATSAYLLVLWLFWSIRKAGKS